MVGQHIRGRCSGASDSSAGGTRISFGGFHILACAVTGCGRFVLLRFLLSISKYPITPKSARASIPATTAAAMIAGEVFDDNTVGARASGDVVDTAVDVIVEAIIDALVGADIDQAVAKVWPAGAVVAL